MRICSTKHDEVCFEGNTCPMCDLMKEVRQKDQHIEVLVGDVRYLEKQIEALKEPVVCAITVARDMQHKDDLKETVQR